MNSLLFLCSFFGFGLFAQNVPSAFSKVERINDEYAVGYNYYSEEFDLFGDPYLISSFDTVPISISTITCSYASVSPNGKFAYFETLDIGWVFPSEVDSFLHDKWYGAVVDLSTAKVVKNCTIDCGYEWNIHNLWMQNVQIMFNGNDTIQHAGETIFGQNEGSMNKSWISYHENGQVRETGQSSDVFACGLDAGTHSFYNDEGILVRTIQYKNWLPDSAQGCHEVIQEKYVSDYLPYHTLKSRKMFQSVYEGEEYKTGVWVEFDENGKLISSKNHGLKYKK